MKKNKYIIAGCVLFLLIFAAFLLKQTVGDKESNQPVAKLLDDGIVPVWEKLPYVSIKDEKKLDEYLKGIEIQGEAGLVDAEQKAALLEAFKTMLYAYSKGTWEDFMKFRLPEGSPYQMSKKVFSSIAVKWFQDHPKAKGKDLPGDEELYRWWIERDQPGKGIYKDYWRGVALSEEAHQFLKNTLPAYYLNSKKNAKLGIYISKLPIYKADEGYPKCYSIGMRRVSSSYELLFSYPQDLPDYLEKEYLSANVYCFIQPMEGDIPISLYVKFVWEEKSKQWLGTTIFRADGHHWAERDNPGSQFGGPGIVYVPSKSHIFRF